MPGRRRDPHVVRADQHEAGGVADLVLDLGLQHLQPVELGGQHRADGGRMAVAPLAHQAYRLGGRSGRHLLHVGEVGGQPAPALPGGVGERHDATNVEQCRPRVRQQVLGHRQDDLADDDQVPLEDQLVEGDRDGALDGVLQGHEPVVDRPFRHRGQHVHERRQRPQPSLGQSGFAAEGLLGKGAGRSQEPNRGLWGDGTGHGRAG